MTGSFQVSRGQANGQSVLSCSLAGRPSLITSPPRGTVPRVVALGDNQGLGSHYVLVPRVNGQHLEPRSVPSDPGLLDPNALHHLIPFEPCGLLTSLSHASLRMRWG